MSDNAKLNTNRKLSDDVLEDVTGGTVLLNNAVYNKDEDAHVKTAVKDQNMEGKITLLGTSSGKGSGAAGNRNNTNIKSKSGSSTVFNQRIQNA